MTWVITERKIGRAGNLKQQRRRQQEWDRKYGENWMIGYVVDGEFISQEEAQESIYYKSYEVHFNSHPKDLEELTSLAKVLRNPHSVETGSVDLQVPAIMSFLRRNNLKLKGKEVLDIGSFNNNRSHKISIRLSPLTIKVVGNPKMTLEQFWQDKKCLAIWQD